MTISVSNDAAVVIEWCACGALSPVSVRFASEDEGLCAGDRLFAMPAIVYIGRGMCQVF